MNTKQAEALLASLRDRLGANMQRHPALKWQKVQERLEANHRALASLQQMEATGGEPDLVDYDATEKLYFFLKRQQTLGEFDLKTLS